MTFVPLAGVAIPKAPTISNLGSDPTGENERSCPVEVDAGTGVFHEACTAKKPHFSEKSRVLDVPSAEDIASRFVRTAL